MANNLKKYTKEEFKLMVKSDKIIVDLGCGTRKKSGAIGLDKYAGDGVDIVCDVEKGIPIEDNSVDEIHSNHFLEHVDDTIFIFQEMYRILANGGLVELTVPYYASINAFKDPTHKSFFTEDTFRYFSKSKWYGSDYNINTDFEVVNIKYFYSNLIKCLPFKKYLRRYLFNVVGAMEVKLRAIKGKNAN